MAWDLLEENFNDLTDWTDGDSGSAVSEISPAGQLHQSASGTDIAIIYKAEDFTSDWTVEFKFLLDTVPTNDVDWYSGYFTGDTNQIFFKISASGLYIHDGAAHNLVVSKTWVVDTWYTIRFIAHNSQTDCDVYIDNALEASDADMSFSAYPNSGFYANAAQSVSAEWHIDYLYIGAGQITPSTSSIKKVSGVAYASIKKIGGVAIGSVKKIAGVE